MKVTTGQIKKLRAKTQAGVMDCRKALTESKGDMKKAEQWLLKKGMARAAKRADREVGHGFVAGYSHHTGNMAALAALACETDFVARTDEFKRLAYEIAMQVVGTATEKKEALLKQPWIRDESRTIDELIKEMSAKTGENIVLKGIKFLKLK